jgi:hypothetical protein
VAVSVRLARQPAHHRGLTVRVFPEPCVNDSERPSRAQRDQVACTPVRYRSLERRRISRRAVLTFELEGKGFPVGPPICRLGTVVRLYA